MVNQFVKLLSISFKQKKTVLYCYFFKEENKRKRNEREKVLRAKRSNCVDLPAQMLASIFVAFFLLQATNVNDYCNNNFMKFSPQSVLYLK